MIVVQRRALAFNPKQYPHEHVPCNLCGGSDVTVKTLVDRYKLPTRVVQCDGCGLQFISPRMTRAGYAEFYRKGYRPLYEQLIGRKVSLLDLQYDQQQYAASLLPHLANHLGMDIHVLDIGGSTGTVGRAVNVQHGGKVTVIDPSPDELKLALGCESICASAEDVTEFPQADLALICRTLDHLLDPRGVLERVRKAATWLAVDALNIDSLPSPFGYKVDHPYAFTADTLKAMLAAAGWTVIESWWREGERYVGYLCRRQE